MDEYARLNRIREALDIRCMKQVELVEKTGLTKSAINNWLSQRWQPKQDALYKMAKALNVSEMWLAGYDVPMERPNANDVTKDTMVAIDSLRNDPKRNELADIILKLDDNQVMMVESMLRGLIQKED